MSRQRSRRDGKVSKSGSVISKIMIEIKQEVVLRRSQRVAREVYLPPALRVFGLVGELTQGGTGNASEGSPGGSPKRP